MHKVRLVSEYLIVPSSRRKPVCWSLAPVSSVLGRTAGIVKVRDGANFWRVKRSIVLIFLMQG